MDNIVERVARAICAGRGKDPDARPDISYQKVSGNAPHNRPAPTVAVLDKGPPLWTLYEREARIAISAAGTEHLRQIRAEPPLDTTILGLERAEELIDAALPR